MELIRRDAGTNTRAQLIARFVVIVLYFTASPATYAGEWEFTGSVAGELRIFVDAPEFTGQNDATLSPSISFSPEIVYEWNDHNERLTLVPFLRVDAHDSNRTHADLRQANWLHIATNWDLVVGLDKVFWGVTEARHLVDIINQDDRVEDIDAEDKLGQQMINLNLLRPWGRVSVFILPGFRERTFPASDARLRGPLPIADDASVFESGAGDHHTDLALRWSHVVADWDIGLAHFQGTSREPRLLPARGAGGDLQLIPHYDQIVQTGLDVQLTKGPWLWKLEAINRSGHGERFAATVGGFEYTFFGILDTAADLGVLTEYLYDGRDKLRAPPTALDDDMFFGARLALNDVQDTSALLGSIIDRQTGNTIVFVEAERRIGNRWRLEFESRLFFNVTEDDPLAGISNDSFITLRLSRYF